MISVRKLSNILDSPRVYALWQAPFANSKLVPLHRHNDLTRAARVLEVGCGPGTNTNLFQKSDYLGLDLNPHYIEHARRVHGREFVVADAREFIPPAGQRFDFILLNSFLHHIDDENTLRILHRLRDALSVEGHIHILDLVLPERPGVARWLARNDRGDYARPLERWRALLGSVFGTVVFEPFALRALGVDLWKMVYFKGNARL
jgi:SAM-dependent methyltransferase